MAWSATPARADGDPASDVLATGPLFLPADAGIPAPELAQLEALVQAAGRSGYAIRVALIASPSDLGSITALWRQPTEYANFLGEELSLGYHSLLLVVMPNGFGLYDHGRSTRSVQAALSGIPIHPAGAGLGATTMAAIRRLASAAGHPLALPRGRSPSAGAPANVVPWIAFAAGLALIALAWTASLRARPLREPRSA